MATSTTKTASVSAAAVAELEKDLAAVVKELADLRKKVAACEAACKAPPPAPAVDESKLVSRKEWAEWKKLVARKIRIRL